ncbi:hypothetical protein MUP01_01340 [Candidatus Bathyarchaeota archaeon]|nr:hypothetical protein [Candidatus Bathyarchaeota archaeon]
MREELDRIEMVKKHMIEHTIKDPYPQFVIEPEIVKYASWLTELMLKRTRKSIGKEQSEQGVIGQELFSGVLLQFKIPNVYANPLYEDMKIRQIEGKHFDFIVPHMPEGKRIISVKTTPEGSEKIRFMANVKSWKDEVHDIAVAIKIDSLKDCKAHIDGWLEAKTVETLPINDWGEGPAYWTYLDPELVNGNKESEISGSSSPKLKPLNSARNIMDELLSYPNS